MSAADALRALKTHLTPLFDSSAVLVASSPAGKAKELANSLGEAHASVPLPVLPEDELSSTLGGSAKAAIEHSVQPDKLPSPSGDAPQPATGGIPQSGGHSKTGFSKQFKCECPKCDPAFQVRIAFGGQVPLS